MILKIIFALGGLTAVALVMAAMRPRSIRIQRSISVSAPPEKVFLLINDFRQWPRWAPQDREDVTMQRSFSGAASGVGAVSEWNSKGNAGKGRMSITDSVPCARVSIKVDFERPFAVHNLNQFVLEPAGPLTKITWTMQGTNLYFMRLMGILMNMDRMMGKHFE